MSVLLTDTECMNANTMMEFNVIIAGVRYTLYAGDRRLLACGPNPFQQLVYLLYQCDVCCATVVLSGA